MAIDLNDLVRMDQAALEDYILNRLCGKTHDPQSFPDRDDEPEYFLTHAFENGGDKKFRDRIKKAIVNLLGEVRIQSRVKNAQYISRLLYLVEFMDIEEARPKLLELWEQKDKLKDIVGHHTDKLLIQVISAVTQFQKGQEFLKELVPMLDDPDYAPVAYTAIMEIKLEPAIEYLPRLANTAMETEKDIWIRRSLEFLDDLYGAKEVVEQWKSNSFGPDGRIKEKIESIMANIPEYEKFVKKEKDGNKRDHRYLSSPGTVRCFELVLAA